MDRFDEAEQKLVQASQLANKLFEVAERSPVWAAGPARLLLVELEPLKQRIEICLAGEVVTPEFLEETVLLYDRILPRLMAVIDAAGVQ